MRSLFSNVTVEGGGEGVGLANAWLDHDKGGRGGKDVIFSAPGYSSTAITRECFRQLAIYVVSRSRSSSELLPDP